MKRALSERIDGGSAALGRELRSNSARGNVLQQRRARLALEMPMLDDRLGESLEFRIQLIPAKLQHPGIRFAVRQ